MGLPNFCMVCGVKNQENMETLYQFPNSPKRKGMWLTILNIDQSDIKSRSRVCEKHFKKDDVFIKKLKKGALPIRKDIPAELPLKQPVLRKPSQIYPKPPEVLSIPGCQQPLLVPIIVTVNVLNSVEHGQESISNIKPNDHSKCRRTLKDAKRRLNIAKKRLKEKVSIDDIFSSNPIFRDIIKAQIQRYKDKNSPYNNFERTTALSLYYACGKNGYRTLLSMGMKIPSVSTVLGWISDFKIGCGINEPIIDGIHEMIETIPEEDRDGVLVWDEMSMKQWIEYNKFTDQFEGIVDLGKTLGRSLETANEALVFMVHGISKKWKFPVSYYFSNHSTKSCHLAILVEENIIKLKKAGLRIRVGICDMSFTNQGLYRSWDINPDKPFRYFDDEKVYFIHDTPHLIKLIRNNLLKHNFYLAETKENDTFKQIRWAHILAFFNKDRRLTTRMAPRLTKDHLDLKDFSKMKVRLAVQLLSSSVYAGMMTMIKINLLKPEAEATARFIKKVDEMFDFLNISHYTGDKNTRCAKYFYKDFYKFDEFISFVKSISVPDFNRRPDFLNGLELTLCGMKQLTSDLRKNGYACVFTRWLQQDCLENFFAVMRMKGGFCRNPTARQFRTNFRFLYFSTMIANPTNGNTECVEPQFAKYLENFKRTKLLRKKLKSNNDGKIALEVGNYLEVDDVKEGLDPSKFYGIKKSRKLILGIEQEKCAVAYLGGACIHFILTRKNCDNCATLVQSQMPDNHSSMHFLVDFKEFDPFSNRLVYLKTETFDFFMFIDTKFDKYAIETLKDHGSQVLEGIVGKYLGDSVVREWLNCELQDCQSHRSTMLTHFVKVKIYRLVKDKNEINKKPKAWDQSRRELRDQ